MDRRSFLRLGAGGAALALLPLGGCTSDDLPSVDQTSGPTVFDAHGTRYQLFPREHALVIEDHKTGGLGTAAGRLNFPIAITLAGGLAYVVDHGNHRVQAFDVDGASVAIIGAGELMYPSGIVARGKELFVADSSHGRIVSFSPDGTVTRVLGEGVLSAPRGLAVLGDHLLVADPGLRQVLELDRNGKVHNVIGSGWVLPWDVATDGTMIFVADAAAPELAVIPKSGPRRSIPLDAGPRFVTLAADGVLYTG